MEETREIPLTQGKVAIVDAADYEWINQWKWYAHYSKHPDTWYARRNEVIDGKRITILMHRVITNAPSDMQVDHKDGDGLNNRRSTNLRVVSDSQNCLNRQLYKSNTAGHKGVSFHKRIGQWQSRIQAGGERKHLGYFDKLEDAARAYREAANLMHGEFSCY